VVRTAQAQLLGNIFSSTIFAGRKMFRAFLACALILITEAGISCSFDNGGSGSIQKNYITTWTCDQMPIPNMMRWEVANPYGWTISTMVSSGGNGCTGGSVNPIQPEGSIQNHRLRNATATTIGCPDFPCCLRISCSNGNSGDCTNLGVKSVYMNPSAFSIEAAVSSENFTTAM
jgi:hypothetical protein